jgi:hypothetical protein
LNLASPHATSDVRFGHSLSWDIPRLPRLSPYHLVRCNTTTTSSLLLLHSRTPMCRGAQHELDSGGGGGGASRVTEKAGGA